MKLKESFNKRQAYVCRYISNKFEGSKLENLFYAMQQFDKKSMAPYFIAFLISGIGLGGSVLTNTMSVTPPNMHRVKEINETLTKQWPVDSLYSESFKQNINLLIQEKTKILNKEETKMQIKQAEDLENKIKTYGSLGGSVAVSVLGIYGAGLYFGRKKEERLSKNT
ncbi:hypothetical protein COV13_04085 [Candidatus Woesearchaeota archaeon CG10_big_fil_rev_8_21_14_0_10_32_9]|nr:MAG: hypothetical protein COV13_04085 [Candidatus Woesearchaeota archaeon CG10_big_fil_rev_8_21_14_0_10_32_9]